MNPFRERVRNGFFMAEGISRSLFSILIVSVALFMTGLCYPGLSCCSGKSKARYMPDII